MPALQNRCARGLSMCGDATRVDRLAGGAGGRGGYSCFSLLTWQFLRSRRCPKARAWLSSRRGRLQCGRTPTTVQKQILTICGFVNDGNDSNFSRAEHSPLWLHLKVDPDDTRLVVDT